MAAEIDQEQIEIHKFGKDVYTKRFPELETLVVMVSKVEVISNDLSLTGVSKSSKNGVFYKSSYLRLIFL